MRGLATGSSPRGRGKRQEVHAGHTGVGLIPARAGKTVPGWVAPVQERAHPRAGGENIAALVAGLVYFGSSPRGRGKLVLACNREPELGLIPARAGKTAQVVRITFVSTAHPRAGGENRRTTSRPRQQSGSSPRGRGKPGNHRLLRREPGLIPARAGKTARCPHGACSAAAHPRAGGENVIASSLEQYTRRLIPARAGKTRRNRPPRLTTRAHPRAGGENDCSRSAAALTAGSSPRGRGKPCIRRMRAGIRRLIPARAGKTQATRERS